MNQTATMKIIKAQVILTRGTDCILITTDLPSTMPAISKDNAVLKIECAANEGVQYVKDNFNLEPEVIDAR